MDHRSAVDLLPDLLAGELDEDRREELQRHLTGCADCREWKETYVLFSEALDADSAEHLSSEQLARHAAGGGRLAAPELEAIEVHLASCPECTRELALTAGALAEARTPAPESLASPVVTHPRFSFRQAAPRLALAAALVLALALSFVARRPTAAPEARVERQIVADQLIGNQLIEGDSIQAEAVTIVGGSEITFRAGESVTFSDGFSVGGDANFKVEIAEEGKAPGRKAG